MVVAVAYARPLAKAVRSSGTASGSARVRLTTRGSSAGFRPNSAGATAHHDVTAGEDLAGGQRPVDRQGWGMAPRSWAAVRTLRRRGVRASATERSGAPPASPPSPAAALRYQRATRDRDTTIAEAMGAMIRSARTGPAAVEQDPADARLRPVVTKRAAR